LQKGANIAVLEIYEIRTFPQFCDGLNQYNRWFFFEI